ncbi:MAG: hypothetical protein IJ594_03815, partial [Oscillospiraceae bacterium]|nr:hypothetical protein [Oscillospiraceae bacterium]
MIRTLQKKFIVTAMIAVTVLLAAVLGVVNLANALTQTRQSERLLQSLAMQEGFGPAMRAEDERPGRFDGGPGGVFGELPSEDSRMAALYFVVRLDAQGEVLGVDLRRIASVDEDEARALALQAAAETNGYGRIGDL